MAYLNLTMAPLQFLRSLFSLHNTLTFKVALLKAPSELSLFFYHGYRFTASLAERLHTVQTCPSTLSPSNTFRQETPTSTTSRSSPRSQQPLQNFSFFEDLETTPFFHAENLNDEFLNLNTTEGEHFFYGLLGCTSGVDVLHHPNPLDITNLPSLLHHSQTGYHDTSDSPLEYTTPGTNANANAIPDRDRPQQPSPSEQLDQQSPTRSSPGSTKSSSTQSLIKANNLNPKEAARKRMRNTQAARKYRQKRVDRTMELEEALEDMTSQRDELRLRLARQEAETKVLREMMMGFK